MTELWDLYDENCMSLHKTHIRGNKKLLGEYHIVSEIWTINDNGEILLTLRSPDKEDYPNLWETTGGSTLTNECSRNGAVRELFEETGISVSESEIVFLGTLKETSAFVDTYIVKKNIDIKDLTMQPGETVAAQWVTIDKLNEMIDNNLIASPVVNRLSPLCEVFMKYINGEL